MSPAVITKYFTGAVAGKWKRTTVSFHVQSLRSFFATPAIAVGVQQASPWYARQIKEGVQVVISHAKLVETGLDLLDFPTILFYESGYSLHILRQASRRSWRIGQRPR
jgi:hypothetical protein